MQSRSRSIFFAGLLLSIVSLSVFGCGSKSKDKTVPTGTGIFPTGTGTYPTGTGTNPTGTGTNPTGTGTNPTGTGTNPTGTGTLPTPMVLNIVSGSMATGYVDTTDGNKKYDGDIVTDYYNDSTAGIEYFYKYGWMKIDLSGIPTTAKISSMYYHYYVLEKSFPTITNENYHRGHVGISNVDPQSGSWTTMPMVLNGYGYSWTATTRYNFTPPGWYEGGISGGFTKDDVNDAIASGKGWVTVRWEGC
ncbi:MAG: hypothetical protein ACYS8W_12425 [Planctomycetota bacterium]|jgi:hypothetical protein